MFCGYRFHEIEWNWLRHERQTKKKVKKKKYDEAESKLTAKKKKQEKKQMWFKSERKNAIDALGNRICL